MKLLSRFLALLTIVIFLSANVRTVSAFPVLPSSFYGEVKVNWMNAPEGTMIEAIIDGTVVATGVVQTYENNSVYAINVPGEDIDTPGRDGGKEGDTISFRVGGQMADQTAAWHSGTNVSVDLSLKTTSALLSAQEVASQINTQTTIPYADSVRATLSVPVTGEERINSAIPSIIVVSIIVTILFLVGLGIWILKERKKFV